MSQLHAHPAVKYHAHPDDDPTHNHGEGPAFQPFNAPPIPLLLDDEHAVEKLARAMGKTSSYIDISWPKSWGEGRMKNPPIPKEYLETAQDIIEALRGK